MKSLRERTADSLFSELCFGCSVARFSPCFERRCKQFTCNLYVIIIAFCQLWISSWNIYWLIDLLIHSYNNIENVRIYFKILSLISLGKFNCEACKKKCKKEAIRLQDKYFHVTCFTCKGNLFHVLYIIYISNINLIFCRTS